MVDASRFVDGASVDVQRLVATIIGGIITTYWAMWTRFFDEAANWSQTLLFSPFDAASALLRQILMIPANSFDAAYLAAELFYLSLEPAGPLIYPIAMVVTLGTVMLTQQIVERMGVS